MLKIPNAAPAKGEYFWNLSSISPVSISPRNGCSVLLKTKNAAEKIIRAKNGILPLCIKHSLTPFDS
jgi:hypothetical protein